MSNDPWEHVERDGATYVRHKNGIRIKWQSKHFGGPHVCGERGDVTDQSRASRHRAAYAFGNAECEWLAMILLTWPGDAIPGGDEVKRCLRDLRRAWFSRWGEGMDAWLMEMHKSGVPHFHLFVASGSEFGRMAVAMPTREVRRRGKLTTVFGGSLERWLVGTWLEIIGQLGNEDALAFNRGGIIERLRSSDAAGRYVAKECSKREQKVLPSHYADGLGRWWWLNPRWKERERSKGAIDGAKWKFEGPVKHVWQANDIQEALIAIQTPDPRPPGTGRTYTLQRRDGKMWDLAAAAGVQRIISDPSPLLPGIEKQRRRVLDR